MIHQHSHGLSSEEQEVAAGVRREARSRRTSPQSPDHPESEPPGPPPAQGEGINPEPSCCIFHLAKGLSSDLALEIKGHWSEYIFTYFLLSAFVVLTPFFGPSHQEADIKTGTLPYKYCLQSLTPFLLRGDTVRNEKDCRKKRKCQEI